MNKYVVKLYARAYRDLDGIYTYIAENLLEPDTALNMADELESAIFSLEQLPERGAVRRAGAYANGNYRQLFVKNYTEKTAPKNGLSFFPLERKKDVSADKVLRQICVYVKQSMTQENPPQRWLCGGRKRGSGIEI